MHYEWANNNSKLALLLASQELLVILTGPLLRAFEDDEYRSKLKPDFFSLLHSFSYPRPTLKTPWKAVHWADSGTLLQAVSEDWQVALFDASLYAHKLLLCNQELNGVSVLKLEAPKTKNPAALKILESIYSEECRRFVLKRSVALQVSDPFIVGGGIAYNLVVYRLGHDLPWKRTSLNEYWLICEHLENGRIQAAFNLMQCVGDPEVYGQVFAHLAAYLMRRPKSLAHPKIIEQLIRTHLFVACRQDFDYLKIFLMNTFEQIGQRLLAIGRHEETFRVALVVESAKLMRNIEVYCKWKGRLVLAETAKKEAMRIDPSITTLAQEMAKISDYTHKALTGEDIQNVINDYHTLMNVSSIHELDLDEFNSWEINLKEYEKALQLELDGDFDEAKRIYEKSKLTADAKRAETLSQLMKSINQNAVQFTEVAEVTQKDNK